MCIAEECSTVWTSVIFNNSMEKSHSRGLLINDFLYVSEIIFSLVDKATYADNIILLKDLFKVTVD